MAVEEIIEQPPPQPDDCSTNITTRYRRFSVIAKSRFEAQQKLEGRFGLILANNVAFQDVYGNIDPTCILQRITIDGKRDAPANGSGHYIADLTYSTIQPDKKSTPGGPWIWVVRAGLQCSVVDLDIRGRRIRTISEEPIDPPLTAMLPAEVLHGEGYVQAPDEITAYARYRSYIGTINASPVFGTIRGCLLCHPFQTQASDSGWVRLSVDLEYRKPKTYNGVTYGGWIDVFEQRGTRSIDVDADDPADRFVDITVKDDMGVNRPISSPVPLDDEGQPQDTSTDYTPAYGVVENYTYTEFSQIPGVR